MDLLAHCLLDRGGRAPREMLIYCSGFFPVENAMKLLSVAPCGFPLILLTPLIRYIHAIFFSEGLLANSETDEVERLDFVIWERNFSSFEMAIHLGINLMRTHQLLLHEDEYFKEAARYWVDSYNRFIFGVFLPFVADVLDGDWCLCPVKYPQHNLITIQTTLSQCLPQLHAGASTPSWTYKIPVISAVGLFTKPLIMFSGLAEVVRLTLECMNEDRTICLRTPLIRKGIQDVICLSGKRVHPTLPYVKDRLIDPAGLMTHPIGQSLFLKSISSGKDDENDESDELKAFFTEIDLNKSLIDEALTKSGGRFTSAHGLPAKKGDMARVVIHQAALPAFIEQITEVVHHCVEAESDSPPMPEKVVDENKIVDIEKSLMLIESDDTSAFERRSSAKFREITIVMDKLLADHTEWSEKEEKSQSPQQENETEGGGGEGGEGEQAEAQLVEHKKQPYFKKLFRSRKVRDAVVPEKVKINKFLFRWTWGGGRYIENLFEHLKSFADDVYVDCNEYMTDILQNLLADNFTQILNSDKHMPRQELLRLLDEDADDLHERQKSLNNLHGDRMILKVVSLAKNGLTTQPIYYKRMVLKAVEFGIRLLTTGNNDVQSSIVTQFESKEMAGIMRSEEEFFVGLNSLIKEFRAIFVNGPPQSTKEARYRFERMEHFIHVVKFVQLMCEGQFRGLQELMLTQKRRHDNVNLMETLVNTMIMLVNELENEIWFVTGDMFMEHTAPPITYTCSAAIKTYE